MGNDWSHAFPRFMIAKSSLEELNSHPQQKGLILAFSSIKCKRKYVNPYGSNNSLSVKGNCDLVTSS